MHGDKADISGVRCKVRFIGTDEYMVDVQGALAVSCSSLFRPLGPVVLSNLQGKKLAWQALVKSCAGLLSLPSKELGLDGGCRDLTLFHSLMSWGIPSIAFLLFSILAKLLATCGCEGAKTKLAWQSYVSRGCGP